MKNLLLILFFTVLLINCDDNLNHERQQGIQGRSSTAGFFTYDDNYARSDLNFSNFAKVIDDLIQNNSLFREKLLSEAALRFDNAYDILVEDFVYKHLSTSESSNISILELINEKFEELNLTVDTYQVPQAGLINYPSDPAQQLIHLYPSLNISVPVNIADWNETSKPPVVYVQENYNEGSTKFVNGFQNGQDISLSAESEPEFPVVVIGLNERISSMTRRRLRLTEPPVVDIILTGNPTESGILLSWDFNSYTNEIQGYHIFRKELGLQNYVHIGMNDDVNNKTYFDIEIAANKTYSYYVLAFNQFGTSEPSNTVNLNAPDVPLSPQEFDAYHYEIDYTELRWIHTPGNFVQSTELYERVVGVDNTFNLIYSASPTENEYLRNVTNYGKTVLYKCQEVSAVGPSSPKYDVVKLPFRDISQKSDVNLSRASYQDVREIEGWVFGPPEVRISVAKGSFSGSGVIVEEGIEYFFNDRVGPAEDIYPNSPRSNSENHFFFVSEWSPVDFLDTYTFHVVEFDHTAKVDLNLSAGFEQKNAEKTGFIKGNVNVKFEDLFNSRDEVVGKSEVSYYDPINFVLQFPTTEFQIELF